MNTTCYIVTYNSERHIAGCVDAAKRSAIEDIVIWDNASVDATLDTVNSRDDSGLRIVRSATNIGFAKAVNAAVATCPPSDRVLLLNPDCLVTAELIQTLTAILDGDARVGFVAPGMIYPDGHRGRAGGGPPTITKELIRLTRIDEFVTRLHLTGFLSALLPSRLSLSLRQYHLAQQTGAAIALPWVSGFCMLARRDAWVQLGGFDENYFMYFEDVELCARAWRAGWQVICARDIAAIHDESASSQKHEKNRLYLDSMRRYFMANGNWLQRSLAPAIAWLSR